MSDPDMKRMLDGALAEIQSLHNRVADLERRSGQSVSLPDTAILNQSFLRRAFTIWGHNFVAGMIIAIPIWLIVIIILAVLAGLK